jgi:hypothetical protein
MTQPPSTYPPLKPSLGESTPGNFDWFTPI